MDTKNILAAGIAAALVPSVLNHSIGEAQPPCVAALPTTAPTMSACPDKEPAIHHDHREPVDAASRTYTATTGFTITPIYQAPTGVTVTPGA